MSRAQTSRIRGTTIALATVAIVAFGSSCDENLPVSPTPFSTQLQIVLPHDTLVVGDSMVATATATDAAGHIVQSLKFGWTSADSTIVDLVAGTDADGVAGRSLTLIGRRPGRALVSIALPDLRFLAPAGSRNETVVVGGVQVLTAHDSILTAINDTGVAIATSLVKSNGALVPRASLGIHWVHLGQHTTVVGSGDTIRYVAKSNGPDTLIATHDFCLVSARCADTVVAHVAQLLTLTLSTHTFSAWSFGDSLGPTVTLADSRGSGLAGTSVRFVPVTAADSVIVKVTPPIGMSDPVTGVVAAPRLISAGNGTARVRALALMPDGISVVGVDSVTETVRQVARHLAVEPLRAVLTANDSLPIKPVARDARGWAISDAAITLTPVGVVLNVGTWAGPTAGITSPSIASITPALTGISLPDSNPLAPQVPVIVNPAELTLLKPDTVVAGTTQRVVTLSAFDSLAQAAAGKWVRFGTSSGIEPDSVQISATGAATVTWTPPNIAATYTLTGVRGTIAPLATRADSAGRVVVLRSVVVKADVASELKTTVGISATTIAVNATATVTVTVKDRFGNNVKDADGSEFVMTSAGAGGTFGAITCTLGVCTATYTAPAAPGAASIVVQINGVDVLLSPLAVTITP
jgi:Invasin, domain 3